MLHSNAYVTNGREITEKFNHRNTLSKINNRLVDNYNFEKNAVSIKLTYCLTS